MSKINDGGPAFPGDVPERIFMPAGWEVLDGTIPVDARSEADDVEYIRADLVPPPGWQPIETAPRGGQAILGWSDGLMEVICWDDCGAGPQWCCAGEELCSMEQPTHWMLLPATPSEDKK